MSRIYRMRRAVYYCAGGLAVLAFLPHAAPSLLMKRYVDSDLVLIVVGSES